MDYVARGYSPALCRFVSADTIAPGAGNPQAFNRYMYVVGNPLKYSDPSGHVQSCECDGSGYNPTTLYVAWTYGADRSYLRSGCSQYYGAHLNEPLPERRGDPSGNLLNAYSDSAVDGLRDAEAAAGYMSEASQMAFGERLSDLKEFEGNTNSAGMSLMMMKQAGANVSGQFGPSRFGPTECSFAGDTSVATDEGAVAISAVVTGSRVLAWDEMANTTGYYPVTNVWVHWDPVLIVLIVNGETITTTPEHPFYTPMHGWLPYGALWVGAGLRRADGSAGIVESTKTVTRTERMWNLTVLTAHTYYVGDRQVLVHNDCLRLGGKTATNLTPRAVDVQSDRPGLSLTTTPGKGWMFGKMQPQDFEAYGFKVTPDETPSDPGHFLLVPGSNHIAQGWTLQSWAAAREGTMVQPENPSTWHPLTALLVSLAER